MDNIINAVVIIVLAMLMSFLTTYYIGTLLNYTYLISSKIINYVKEKKYLIKILQIIILIILFYLYLILFLKIFEIKIS